MNKVELISTAIFILTLLGLSSQASATLVLEEYGSGVETPEVIGGYAMTDFNFSYPVSPAATNSVDSPLGGTLNFTNKYGAPVMMDHSSANSEGWWANGEMGVDNDYDIYTTSLHLIKITLPTDTLAFALNSGANMWAGAWLTVAESIGPGIPDRKYFGLGPNKTPGFGIYADNSNGCSHITSVIIDPHLIWGFGNFSISQGDCSARVPEPSIMALFAAGLFGVGFARRRIRN